ncbi:MAG TPA: hypothetical protein VK461_13980 [Acidimicrobiales bacterium]|nr:hypothetical protein [Acidimicrobiales bacterium]
MTEGHAEAVAYGVAVLILIVGGALVRTALLNWICGPGVVIACVGLIPPLLTARGDDR